MSDKVYVITKGNYSDYRICAVTMDRERAAVLEKMYSTSYEDAVIEEYTLNETIQMTKFGVMFDYKGAFKRFVADELDVNPHGTIDDYDLDKTIVWVEAKDFDHAKKIAQDKLAEYNAKKEGII